MAGNLVRKVLVGVPGAELSVSDSRHKDARESALVEVLSVFTVGFSSTLAIFQILKQIQWFSGSGLETLSPCFAMVFFCKWPKSSSEDS